MKTTREKGFSIVLTIVIVAVILTVGLIVWRLVDSGKTSGTKSANTGRQQAEPQYQADQNEGYVVIKEWGVRFKPVVGLKDVHYFNPSGLTADQLTFTTKELADASANCRESSGDIILGLLTRSKENNPEWRHH